MFFISGNMTKRTCGRTMNIMPLRMHGSTAVHVQGLSHAWQGMFTICLAPFNSHDSNKVVDRHQTFTALAA